VKIISMGFFMKEGDATIWRGPMLHKMVEQFLGGVEWGELDYLVIDLPPGTGDIQLSLCQTIPLTGAAVVSTPQDVALKVAQKAIAMFNKLNTPVLGMIENMSHYICPHCNAREDIFGAGGARAAAERLHIPFLGEIPLMKVIRTTADEGRPIVLSDPTSPAAQAFIAVAEKLAAQISVKNMAGELTHDIKINF
jgi:ATP-binding protein involved in chromosome partitioning